MVRGGVDKGLEGGSDDVPIGRCELGTEEGECGGSTAETDGVLVYVRLLEGIVVLECFGSFVDLFGRYGRGGDGLGGGGGGGEGGGR